MFYRQNWYIYIQRIKIITNHNYTLTYKQKINLTSLEHFIYILSFLYPFNVWPSHFLEQTVVSTSLFNSVVASTGSSMWRFLFASLFDNNNLQQLEIANDLEENKNFFWGIFERKEKRNLHILLQTQTQQRRFHSTMAYFLFSFVERLKVVKIPIHPI